MSQTTIEIKEKVSPTFEKTVTNLTLSNSFEAVSQFMIDNNQTSQLITSYYNHKSITDSMEFPTPMSELVVFLAHVLRFPRDESREYAKELTRIGYDDIQCK